MDGRVGNHVALDDQPPAEPSQGGQHAPAAGRGVIHSGHRREGSFDVLQAEIADIEAAQGNKEGVRFFLRLVTGRLSFGFSGVFGDDRGPVGQVPAVRRLGLARDAPPDRSALIEPLLGQSCNLRGGESGALPGGYLNFHNRMKAWGRADPADYPIAAVPQIGLG
jgi:hypothetical protein